MTKAQSDLILAKALIKGDAKVFNQFFTDYYPKVYRFALNRVNGDKDLADDMAQTTLCKALDKMSTYRGDAALFTWICQICRSFIYAYYLKEKRRNSILKPIADSDDAREILSTIAMSDESQPENIAETLELNGMVGEILDNLPNNYGDLLEWMYVEQLSVAEIANKLNTSLVSVQSSLARARKSFKTVITQMMENQNLQPTFANFMEKFSG